jgi:hypothetical protein
MIGKPICDRPEQRKKKEPKKKESCGRGSLWKLPQPRKSFKLAFGNIFLMISTAAWKTLLGFPQLPQARRRLLPLQLNCRRQSLDSVTFLGEAIRPGVLIVADHKSNRMATPSK